MAIKVAKSTKFKFSDEEWEEIRAAKKHGMKPFLWCRGCDRKKLVNIDTLRCKDCDSPRAPKGYRIVSRPGDGDGWIKHSSNTES